VNPVPNGTDQIFLICSTIGRIDHGKEVEGKEEIHEEKGRPGAQKEEDSKGGSEEAGEKSRQEGPRESGKEGSSETESGAEKANACAGSGCGDGTCLDTSRQSRAWRRAQLVSVGPVGGGRRPRIHAAAPPTALSFPRRFAAPDRSSYSGDAELPIARGGRAT
jgi:hypothetical protein